MTDTDTPFSSVAFLTCDALDAAISEQTNNKFQHDRQEYSEWNRIEVDHVMKMIFASREMLLNISAAIDRIGRAFDSDNPDSVIASLVAFASDAIRVGWHCRGHLVDAQYLSKLYKQEAATDQVEEWRRSICELGDGC
jgi:hypothetical protein